MRLGRCNQQQAKAPGHTRHIKTQAQMSQCHMASGAMNVTMPHCRAAWKDPAPGSASLPKAWILIFFDIFDVEPYESCLQRQAAGSSVPVPLSDLSSNDAFQTHEKRTKQVVWGCLLLVHDWIYNIHELTEKSYRSDHCRHFSVISNQAIQTDHAALTES